MTLIGFFDKTKATGTGENVKAMPFKKFEPKSTKKKCLCVIWYSSSSQEAIRNL